MTRRSAINRDRRRPVSTLTSFTPVRGKPWVISEHSERRQFVLPRPKWRRAKDSLALLEILVGRRLANREAEQRKITTIEGLPAIGLDDLASSAYGPEAALSILLRDGGPDLAVVIVPWTLEMAQPE